MSTIKILWADDEQKLLKPQIMFLEKKGYEVVPVTNGHDAIEEVSEKMGHYDIVFLDESMPGITGLETLDRIKELAPHLPVVMITKNEAEDVMEQAIGSKISDYLLKPVNPLQLLSTLRKLVDGDRLVQEETRMKYQQEFRNILMAINNSMDAHEWAEVYKKIIYWELKLDASKTASMADILATQKDSANAEFAKFIDRNYVDWLNNEQSPP